LGDSDAPAAGPAFPARPPGSPAKPKGRGAGPDGGPGGLYVYIGPSVHGAIVSGTEFDTGRDGALAELNGAIGKFPLVAGLTVPRGSLPECRINVKTPGTLLYERYNRFVRDLKR